TTNAVSANTSQIPITVNTKVTPSVSVVVSPSSTICSGQTATFTATPVNGGTPTYNWQINGVTVSSGTSATFSWSNLNDGDVVRVIMTSTVQCKTAGSATSNSITMSVNPIVPASITIASSGMPLCEGT